MRPISSLLFLFVLVNCPSASSLDEAIRSSVDESIPSDVRPSQHLDASTLLDRALAFVREGRIEEASKAMDLYEESQPLSAASEELRGVILSLQGRAKEGLARFESAIEIDPWQATAYTKAGDVYFAMGDMSAAQEKFEKAIELNPNDRLAYQRLGLIAESRNDIAKAIDYFERGIIGVPAGYVGIKVNLARLYNASGQYAKTDLLLSPLLRDSDENPTGLLTLGTAWLFLDKRDQARTLFQRVAEMPSLDGDSRLKLGLAFKHLGDLDQALESFRIAKRQLSETASIDQEIAEILAETDREDEAVFLLETTVESDSARPETFASLASLYQSQLRFEEAEELLLQGRKRFEESHLMALRLGLHYAMTQRYGVAVEVLVAALERNPSDRATMKALSLAELRLGNIDAALLYARRLVNLHEEDVEALFYLATMLEEAERADEARRWYKKAVEIDPNHVASLNNLANNLLEENDLEAAKRYAIRAVEIAPSNPIVLDSLAWIEFKSGDLEAARTHFDRALAADSVSPTHRFRAAQLYIELEQSEEATQQLALALADDARFPERHEAERLYKHLTAASDVPGHSAEL